MSIAKGVPRFVACRALSSIGRGVSSAEKSLESSELASGYRV